MELLKWDFFMYLNFYSFTRNFIIFRKQSKSQRTKSILQSTEILPNTKASIKQMDQSQDDNPNPLMSSELSELDDIQQSSGQSQQGKKKYSVIPQEVREKFIKRVISREVTIQQAAKEFGIQFSTSQAILQTYQKEGRIGKQKTRQRKPRMTSRQTNIMDNEVNYTPPIFSTSNEPARFIKEEQTKKSLTEIHNMVTSMKNSSIEISNIPESVPNVAMNYYKTLNFLPPNQMNTFQILKNQYPNPFDAFTNQENIIAANSRNQVEHNNDSSIQQTHFPSNMNFTITNFFPNEHFGDLNNSLHHNNNNNSYIGGISENIIKIENISGNTFRDVSNRSNIDVGVLQEKLHKLTIQKLQELIDNYNKNHSNRNLFPDYNYSLYLT